MKNDTVKDQNSTPLAKADGEHKQVAESRYLFAAPEADRAEPAYTHDAYCYAAKRL